MSIFLLPVGLLFPTLTGWLLLRIAEGASPVLFRFERWVMGCVMGLLFTMYVTFLAHISGLIGFTFWGFLFVQIVLTGALGTYWYLHRSRLADPSPVPANTEGSFSPWVWAAVIILGLWTLVKIVNGTMLLALSPPYFDDVINNWGMRGRMYYVTQELRLSLVPGEAPDSLSSYPPAVPMVKTWFANLHGSWSEPLANVPHMIWYLSVLILVYFSLRRMLPRSWSLLGMYLLSSLPLFFMHGIVAYADGFLALHIFLAVSLLFHAVRSNDPYVRMSFFTLSSLATGLLMFTKNESLLLHLPPLLLLLAITLILLRKKGVVSTRDAVRVVLRYGICIAVVLLPWIGFKWAHGLTFGNAKGISGMELSWQKDVLVSVWTNTFFEGNWIFLFPLFMGLILARWRKAILSPLGILTLFVLMVIIGQLPIYMFTGLSTEAVNQTGYARGIVQLIPLVVMVVTVLLADVLQKRM